MTLPLYLPKLPVSTLERRSCGVPRRLCAAGPREALDAGSGDPGGWAMVSQQPSEPFQRLPFAAPSRAPPGGELALALEKEAA